MTSKPKLCLLQTFIMTKNSKKTLKGMLSLKNSCSSLLQLDQKIVTASSPYRPSLSDGINATIRYLILKWTQCLKTLSSLSSTHTTLTREVKSIVTPSLMRPKRLGKLLLRTLRPLVYSWTSQALINLGPTSV